MSAGQPGEADDGDGDGDGDDNDDDDDGDGEAEDDDGEADDDDDGDADGVSARRTGQAQDRMAAELEGVLEHVKVGTVIANILLCCYYDANYVL